MDRSTKASMNAIDVHVGQAVRRARKARRMSQEALAKRLDLTFQQIQKYERGTNRVSASVLWSIARILELPVQVFFEGLPDTPADLRDEDQRSFGRRLAEAGQLVPEIARIPELDAVARRSIGAIISTIPAAAGPAH